MSDVDVPSCGLTPPGSAGSSGSPASCGIAPTPSPNAVIDQSPLMPKHPVHAFFSRWLGLDLRSLALMRLVMGVIVLADLAQRALYLRAHYTDDGVLPRTMLIQNLGDGLYWSLHSLSGDFHVVSLLFVLAGISAAMMTVGYRTRLATILTWIFTVSVINRNPLVGQSGDVLLRLMLLWSCFLPLGARWSVDSAVNSQPRPKDNNYFSPATLALIGQMCLLYWFSAAFKWSPTWLEGQAVYFALHCDMYIHPAGIWLRQFEDQLPMLTYAAIAVEIGVPALALCPFFIGKVRTLCVVLMILTHVAFGVLLAVGVFSPVAIALWLALLPGGFWDAIFRWLGTRARRRLVIYIDGNCGFCWRGAMLLKTFFLLPFTPIRVAQSVPAIGEEMRRENSWVVVDHTGRHHHRAQAAACCFAHSPLGFPVAWVLRLPGVAMLADRTYRVIASNRNRMSLVNSFLTPRPMRMPGGWVSGVFVSLAFLVGVLLNFQSLDPNNNEPKPKTPWLADAKEAVHKLVNSDAVRIPAGILQLGQNWSMYAPSPLRRDGWFVAEGVINNGTTVDLLRDGQPVNWEKPACVASTFPTHRWQKYMENMSRDNYSSCRRGLCRYLCREWNNSHGQSAQVMIISLRMMVEETRYREIMKPEKVLLEVHRCSDIPRAIEKMPPPVPVE